MADRLDIQDLRFLAVAVASSRPRAATSPRSSQGLANVIRARFKLFRKVKAITSEAKFSGTFLSFFPILCLVGINVMQPDYYSEVIDTPAFIPACAVVAVMLAVNMIFMRMMVNIKV
jgi:tight adherence protein B